MWSMDKIFNWSFKMIKNRIRGGILSNIYIYSIGLGKWGRVGEWWGYDGVEKSFRKVRYYIDLYFVYVYIWFGY